MDLYFVEITGRGVVSMMGSGSSGVYAWAWAVERLLERVNCVLGTVLRLIGIMIGSTAKFV